MKKRLTSALAAFGSGRLGGQVLMALGLKAWNAVASFGLSWLIAQNFGAEGSGQFGIAVTTMTFLGYFILCGADMTVVRRVAGDLREGKIAQARGAVNTGFLLVGVMFGALAVLIAVAKALLPTSVFSGQLWRPELLVFLCAVLPLAMQRLLSSALRASGRVFMSQLVDGPLGMTLTVCGLAVALVMGWASTILFPALLYLSGLVVASMLGLFVFRRMASSWPPPASQDLLPFALAGLPILVSSLSNAFTEWYTTISLGSMVSVAVAGHYRAAWQFVAIAGLVQTAMEAILSPRIAAAARAKEPGEIASVARKSFALLAMLTLPVFVVMLLFAEQLLSLFGPEFIAGAPALRVLVVAQALRTMGIPLGSILVMTGNQRWILAYALLGIIPCVVLVALLVPAMGAVGAAWATAATILVRVLCAAIIVDRFIGVKLFRNK